MGRDANPANMDNWCLRCKVCDTELNDETEIGMFNEHWIAEHSEEHGETPELSLVWVGIGQAPKESPL